LTQVEYYHSVRFCHLGHFSQCPASERGRPFQTNSAPGPSHSSNYGGGFVEDVYFTKLLQGSLFFKLRAYIMNEPVKDASTLGASADPQECVEEVSIS